MLILLQKFNKDYGLPFRATLLFILLVLILLLIRFHERSMLADVLGSSSKGEDYATLLSNDKANELKKNEISSEEQAKQTDAKNTSVTAQTTFTISPTASPPAASTPPPSPGTPPPPPSPVFSAAIDYFRQEGASPPQCPPMMGPGQGPNHGYPTSSSCSKTYYFSAGIRAKNGPGRVNYRWQSNAPGGNETSTFSAGNGETFTPLQKRIDLPCEKPGLYTLQLILEAPTQQQSNVITMDHRC